MKDNTALTCIGAIALIVFAFIAAPLLNGWVFATIWGWFVVPLFGLPLLTIPYAIGIALIVQLLTHQPSEKRDDDHKTTSADVLVALVKTFLPPLFFLFMAWIVRLFI